MTAPHSRIVAHRGLTRGFEENSIDAIVAAKAWGSAAIEFDVRLTRDEVWVVYHDKTLERLHATDLTIAEHDYAELRNHHPLPTLAEALTHFEAGCLPMIEVKQPELRGLAALTAVVAPVAARLPVVVIARGDVMPAAIRAAIPDVDVYLYHRDWLSAKDRAASVDGFDLQFDADRFENLERHLEALHGDNRRIALWTINDAGVARRWIDAGADWIITDDPERLSHELS